MKRLTIFALVVGFVTLCLAQSRTATPIRRNSRVSQRKIIQLTEPKLKGSVSLEEALAKRRSVRKFTGEALKPNQVSQLAWAGQGITEPQGGLRTAPSAGAIYPIELYFANEEGLFVYLPEQHSLEQVIEQDVRSDLATTASTPESVANAACDIIVAGSARKLMTQFRDKARTFMLLEAGHVAQNIQLQAVCLDLGSVPVGEFDEKGVNRICRLPRNLEPIYIICVGYPAAEQTPAAGSEQSYAAAKKAVLIAARENFRDEELFDTKHVLESAGVQTVIASSRIGIIRGMLGNTAEAQITLNQLRVDDFDAIIFVGGSGAVEYFDNPVALDIARTAAAKRKVVAAICIAPTVLANSGILTGVRATSFLSERERLIRAGALYSGAPVERDRFIITATDPTVAVSFGQAIADALAGR